MWKKVCPEDILKHVWGNSCRLLELELNERRAFQQESIHMSNDFQYETEAMKKPVHGDMQC